MRARMPHEPLEPEISPQDREVSELDGFIDLGLKKEALRLVRRHLEGHPTPDLFFACLDAILTLANNTPHWRAWFGGSRLLKPRESRPTKGPVPDALFLLLRWRS